ncbi:chemotaxis protein [Pseudomonas gregormendelii]|uniref:Chemotaxis protein n=1 Tax=Pseudomonas gregormendelii TaxID=1628277 RepID=A0ABS3ANM6_9PSED|nr:chemotaxis protein [Pseudomonas gregormendelii]MBN3968783.1 chemotaxis protein [Pseudomonas gregormendelii]
MQINAAAHASIKIIEPSNAAKSVLSEASGDSDVPAVTEGVKVTLSPEGTAKASSETEKNADIDASNLPDGVKKILKAIRDIQEKIQKKMEELDAIKNNHSLSEKEREGKVQGILGELGILTSQLTTTTNDLHRTENEMKLSSSMKKLSNSLSAPRD